MQITKKARNNLLSLEKLCIIQTVYESIGGIFSAVKAKEIEMEGRDLALLTDLYELTMMQGYFETGSYKSR